MERLYCYHNNNFKWISQALPLPQTDKVRFLFGCETDLNKELTLGISPERMNSFDFIIIPTTHLHMKGFTIAENDVSSAERRAQLWVERLDSVLNMDLPFYKIGIAHLTCRLFTKKEYYEETLKLLPLNEMERLFKKAAKIGVGIELNMDDMDDFSEDEAELYLKPYQIAKECKCKFYFGSDAHHPADFEKTTKLFDKAVRLLELKETDKFIIDKGNR